jgi:chromosome segregation ATPase
MIADYKYKLQKAEQEIASLQASLARSETQVIRYKSTADASEKAEADLKIERRRLQREVSEILKNIYYNQFEKKNKIMNLVSIFLLQPLLLELWDECHCQ